MNNLDIRVVRHITYSCRGECEEEFDIAVGSDTIDGLNREQLKMINDAILPALYDNKIEVNHDGE